MSTSSILESSSKNSASLHNTSVNEFQSYFFDKDKLEGLSSAPVSAVKSFGRESNVTFCQTVCKCIALSQETLRESPRISQQLSKPSGRKFNSLRCGNSFLQSSCAVTMGWVWFFHRGGSFSAELKPPDWSSPSHTLSCPCPGA